MIVGLVGRCGALIWAHFEIVKLWNCEIVGPPTQWDPDFGPFWNCEIVKLWTFGSKGLAPPEKNVITHVFSFLAWSFPLSVFFCFCLLFGVFLKARLEGDAPRKKRHNPRCFLFGRGHFPYQFFSVFVCFFGCFYRPDCPPDKNHGFSKKLNRSRFLFFFFQRRFFPTVILISGVSFFFNFKT